jgi:hypothetical protein
MVFELWCAGIGVILVWKIRKSYKSANTIIIQEVAKPKHVYIRKSLIKSAPIIIPEIITNTDDNYYNYVITRSKSLPIIFENISLSL